MFTADEIATHNTETDCWVSLYGEVYNVTKFLDDHPGIIFFFKNYRGKRLYNALCWKGCN